MALINCPECGKEVSDKAAACIHCGYPIGNMNTDTGVNGITALFSKFALTATIHTKIADIYSEILDEVVKIRISHNAADANDIIATSIVDGLIQIPGYLGWADVKLYCELINFEMLSSDAIEYFADKLYTVISIQKFYEDGSGGYCYLTAFYYPEYMVVKYAPASIKEKYMEILNKPFCGSKQTGYDYIVSMYRRNSSIDTIQQIAEVRRFREGVNSTKGIGLKCPICGSSNITKISSIGRFASVATFGLASSKISKQYECKNCKHKW